MKRTTKVLATVAAVAVMGLAAVPSPSQAEPGEFNAVCSALGLPSSTTPISLGALGSVTVTTCTAAIFGPDPCPGPPIPVNLSIPGILNLKASLCLTLI